MLAKAGKLLLLSTKSRPTSSPVHSASQRRLKADESWAALKLRVFQDETLGDDACELAVVAKPPTTDGIRPSEQSDPTASSLHSLLTSALPQSVVNAGSTVARDRVRPASSPSHRTSMLQGSSFTTPIQVLRAVDNPSDASRHSVSSEVLQSHLQRLGACGHRKPLLVAQRRHSAIKTNLPITQLRHIKVCSSSDVRWCLVLTQVGG